jgi:starvation-inducible DNA-binding protein
MPMLNIGLSTDQREGVIDLLNRDLSDTYLVLIKTKKYHWDVVGPQFRSLHMLWDEQYAALSANVDAIAERVRALGGYPVGTAKGFLSYASVQEHGGDVPTAHAMVQNLLTDHELIIRNLRGHIDQSQEKFGDAGTADFLTGLMEQHEEIAWMLRSFIEGESIVPTDKAGSSAKVPVKSK